MTNITDEITRLNLLLVSLQAEIEEYKKQLDEAENSYDTLYDQNEKLENRIENLEDQTEDYRDNKDFFDNMMVHFAEIKDFYTYIQEECEVKPKNKHVYLTVTHAMKKIISMMKGV